MNKDKQYLSVVNGNDFTLNLHVTRWNADNAAYSPYDMTACSQVCCFLVAVTGGRRYKLPVTVDGNVLTADIDGSMLNVGVYGLELLFEDAESHSKRSYEPALLKIARSNAEATYTQADFDSEDDCRLHMTIQANASFITIGSPTADAQIDATSYNAVSNAAVSNAITNLQLQIDTIGSEILDPASVYTKDETEALIDTMVDPQEMEDYVSNALSSYTTTEQFNSSVNDLNSRITAIEESPVDLSSYVSKEELNSAAYLQADALDGLATESYVVEKVSAIDVTDQLADYVSKEELNSAAYLQSDDISDVVRDSDLASAGYITESDVAQMGYITANDLSNAGYVTTTELSSAGYVTTTDLSNAGYVTETELSSAGYVTNTDLSSAGYVTNTDLSSAGYVTETALDTALSSYAKVSDIEDNERVVSTALNSLADRIETVEGDYVSSDELDETLLSYATKNYVDEKIDELAPSDLTEYVSKQFLSQQAYLQADDISDVVRDSDLTSAGYVTTTELSSAGYVTTTELSSAGYVTNTDLTSAGYVTTTELSSAGYVTTTELSSAGYVTTTDLTSAGYVTNTDLTSAGYVTNTDLSSAGYVTTTELSNAGYVTNTDLSSAGYVTTANLNTTLSSYAKVSDIEDNEQVISSALNSLSDRIGLIENDYVSDDELADFATKNYVEEKIDELAPSDLTEYVSKQFLSQQAYLQADDISDVVRDSDLASAGYVTANDLSSAGYVTNTDLTSAGYVTNTDLTSAGYVTETELSSAGYVTTTELSSAGYVTATELSNAGYITETDLSSAGYITTTNLNTALSSYVTDSDLANAGYVTTTNLNTTLADYVTDTDLANAGYLTTTNLNTTLAGYVTETELSSAGYVTDSDLDTTLSSYVTNTALNTTLSSYTTKADVPYKFVVMSYADYTALATKDPNTFYMIPEE